MAVTTGLEMLLDDPCHLSGRRWALLANHAAVTADLVPARLALSRVSEPALLFAPEHGLEGVVQDMEGVDDTVDELTGCRVRSLYGLQASTLAPEARDLESIDLVVVDLPDIGTRYYTFAATMDWIMATCAERGTGVLVLDRPNPIGGVLREGGRVHPGHESFVSQVPTPVRHGLTLAEMALLLARDRYPDLELTVLACRGWRRGAWWDATGLPWVPPSPNMPTLETAAIYPGLCLVEATELSEGRGTTRPFHLVGAPWMDAAAVIARLRALDLPGCAFRAAEFRPMFQKFAGTVCRGVEIHVTDREALRPLELGCRLIETIRGHHPDHFEWRRAPYEFVADVPAIDLLTGSPDFRSALETGTDLAPLFDRWRHEVGEFEARLDGILLDAE